MEEEEVRDMRWVGFVTLVDQQGGQYRQRSSVPIAYGGFSDVWQCDALFSDGSDVVVAVKRLRAVRLPPGLDEPQTTKKLLGRLKTELRVWMRLQHPNVAPLLGFAFDGDIALISPWFSHGNVTNYLEAHPEADRMKLVQSVATGLEYLHSSSPVVVHGDMKPDNVLIDQSGCPRIIDFGLSKVVEEDPSLSSLQSASLRDAGNARWIAPELLLEEDVSRSCQTDMFSLGCVAFFIFTGDIPFKGIPDGQLVIARHKGASPIPGGAAYPSLNPGSGLMEILHSCWNTNPQARPEVGEVVKLLNSTHPGSEPSAKQNSQELRATTGPQMSTSKDVQPPTILGLSQLLSTAISHVNLPGTSSQAGDVSVPLSVLQEILGLGRSLAELATGTNLPSINSSLEVNPQLLRTSSNHAATRQNTAMPTLEATTPTTPEASRVSSYVLTPPVTPAKAKIEAKSLESTLAQKNRSKPVMKTRTPGQLSQPLTTPSKPLGRKGSPNIGSQTTTRSPRPTLKGSSRTPHEKTIAIPTSEAPTPSSSKTSKISSSVLTPPVTPAKAKIEAKSLECTLAQKNRSKPALKARTPGQLLRPLTTPSKPLGRKASPNIGALTTTPPPRLRPTPQNSSSTPHEKNKGIPISEAPTPSSSKPSKISSSVLIPPVTPTKAKIASKSLESTLVQKNRSEPVLKGRTPRQLWQPSTRPSKPPGRKTLPNIESRTTVRSPRPTPKDSSGTPNEPQHTFQAETSVSPSGLKPSGSSYLPTGTDGSLSSPNESKHPSQLSALSSTASPSTRTSQRSTPKPSAPSSEKIK